MNKHSALLFPHPSHAQQTSSSESLEIQGMEYLYFLPLYIQMYLYLSSLSPLLRQNGVPSPDSYSLTSLPLCSLTYLFCFTSCFFFSQLSFCQFVKIFKSLSLYHKNKEKNCSSALCPFQLLFYFFSSLHTQFLKRIVYTDWQIVGTHTFYFLPFAGQSQQLS